MTRITIKHEIHDRAHQNNCATICNAIQELPEVSPKAENKKHKGSLMTTPMTPLTPAPSPEAENKKYKGSLMKKASLTKPLTLPLAMPWYGMERHNNKRDCEHPNYDWNNNDANYYFKCNN